MPQLATAEMFLRAGHHKFVKSGADLAWVSPEMAELLGGEDPRLEVSQLQGALDHPEQDLVVPGDTWLTGVARFDKHDKGSTI